MARPEGGTVRTLSSAETSELDKDGHTPVFMKFERVQWPVGHGGFHSGRIKGGSMDFRYFFDCGAYSKEGKALISERLAATEFDFGVISHFDHDHYCELANVKKLNVLFLPYMTPADMLLQALADQAANTLPMQQAFEGFNVLRQLQAEGTRIVMVSSGEAGSDIPQGQSLGSAGGLSWRIPGTNSTVTGSQVMPHEAPVEVLQGSTKLLYFKFFNHRKEAASQAFAQQLKDAVDAQHLKQADKTPYTNVDDFLADVMAGNSELVHSNGKAMQKIYQTTLATPSLKASPITASNLSSLTMFSRSYRDWRDHCNGPKLRPHGSRSDMNGRDDGWMLTGDLELTSKTWPAFHDHYFCELSECVAFNVPHHASAISLCEEAVALLPDQLFVMPVASEGKHPATQLTERLRRHRACDTRSVTEAWESTLAIESSNIRRY